MRTTCFALTAVSLLTFSPMALAAPEAPSESSESSSEAPAPDLEEGVVPVAAQCYEIASHDELVANVEGYPIGTWGYHALAWKAYQDPTVNYFPPGPGSTPAVPAGPPVASDWPDLATLEADVNVFELNGQNEDPAGIWRYAWPSDIEDAMAYIALGLTWFETPVYVEVGPRYNRQPGEIETFVVERISIATAGQPLGDVCKPANSNSWGACLVGIGQWWTIGEVEGLAYFKPPHAKGGKPVRMTLSGADFTSLMEEARPNGGDYMVYYDADWAFSNQYSYYGDLAVWGLGPFYQRWASAQGCPDKNVGDSFE